MRFRIYVLLVLFCGVNCKINLKSLTESMGQEVIEIGAPAKELPPGIEEEPSADIEAIKTTTYVEPITKRAIKTTTIITTKEEREEQRSDAEQKSDADNTLSQEDEEARVEKELGEIYKDTDYTAEKVESTQESNANATTLESPPNEVDTEEDTVSIVRARDNFQFQPDLSNKGAIEKFRTSIDEITCNKRVTQRGQNPDGDDIDADTKNGSDTPKIFVFKLISLLIMSFVNRLFLVL